MTQSQYFDIAVNLTNAQFKSDLEDVIADASAAGVSPLLNLGCDLYSSIQGLEIANRFAQVYSTAGIHPHDAKSWTDSSYDELKKIASNSKVLAIGECGLDYNRNYSDPNIQRQVFEKQLSLAIETKLPLLCHDREAAEDMVNMIRPLRTQLSQILIHCFTGTEEELKSYLDLDCYIGITGWVCDERRGTELQRLVKYIPKDRIVLETDAPFLLPRNLKPKPKSRRNLPSYLPHISAFVATLLNLDTQEFAKQTYANSLTFFNMTP